MTRKSKSGLRKMARDKGKRGERELAAELNRLFCCEARRGQQFSGSPDSPDVVHSIPGVHIECKRSEKLHLWDAVNQAHADAGDDIPVVCHRANNRPWVAIVPLDRLGELAVQLYLAMASEGTNSRDAAGGE